MFPSERARRAISRRYIPPHFNRHPRDRSGPSSLGSYLDSQSDCLALRHPVFKSSRAEYTTAPCYHVELRYAYVEVAK
ncbi:hypothetical protein BQ8794_30326 [Mesorhizobium prunaredense]|uniref:Uncharacterized protein n=1 Tax=Mesorhizobium prunaredense TaxID=1631249 RepID=A0A1R3VAC8_9HYPH|nr:hypothetical protein BQ8794_30326 [Mesorhizobium prunaredense]